ncbi:MAG: PucR family transcriptional regulator ligand-binding domain-containing protein, partial [Clostridiales bacterium]|nr:PucR family transcriptional regulator ligand-binding domain-containing protein [Clostridiales bacterium]
MIRVRDVVSKPMFSGFRLISDESGLDNVVSGTGIFDWETPEILRSTFDTGEFVLTILDKIEEGRSEYTECIRILIELKVAAIAFKAVNVREIPKEIVDYANLFSIPLFVFSDTYFDDIIFTVKSELQNENLGDVTLGKI